MRLVTKKLPLGMSGQGLNMGLSENVGLIFPMK